MESKFISNPFEIMPPDTRWCPSPTQIALEGYNTLLPPLVEKVRNAVFQWRKDNYTGASETSKALLEYWFIRKKETNFNYYFAQREAIESVIFLFEIANAKDRHDLLKFDSSEAVALGHFIERWTRYVIKMATGSGKTKVISLLIAWSYFHKLYEENSPLSKNILLIAPNIIVLNRLLKDFNSLNIFYKDPIIPPDGLYDRNWLLDFDLTLHIQDKLKAISPNGNLFITNIHRVFLNNTEPHATDNDLTDYFLGQKPKPDADKDKGVDLGKLLRSDKIKELVIINDEAHHIHDESMAWFQNIQDINNTLKLKYNKSLALQLDLTATPKHNKTGSIFVQTISDYPLVEAIKQNIVKHLVLPDEPSRAKLKEKNSNVFVEKFADYIDLGVEEWRRINDILKKEKQPLLFIMTTETKESDQVSEYLQRQFPEFKNKVLVIHTNNSGEINENESKKKSKEDLDTLRKAADDVDNDKSKYKAIVSVLMLREGWDVKNVTTIVGLRPYGDKSKILPEQTIGRGLRKMFSLDVEEELSIIGTDNFIDFVESITREGVELGYRPMGGYKGKGKPPVIISVDEDNEKKDLEKLDISIPILTPRMHREFKKLELIDESKFIHTRVMYKQFTEEEIREITFKDLDGKISHQLEFRSDQIDYRNIIGFFTENILRDNRLFTGFDILYPKVQNFIQYFLFDQEVEVENRNTARNLSEVYARTTISKEFNKAISELTITDKGSAEIRGYINLRKVKPLVVNHQAYMVPKKSIFDKVVGDSGFELRFADFLEKCDDILCYAKNTTKVNFRIDYVGEDGNIHDFYPDFLIKKDEKTLYIVETKGREDLNDVRKISRLVTWCNDANAQTDDYKITPLYIKEEAWDKYKTGLKCFKDIVHLSKIE